MARMPPQNATVWTEYPYWAVMIPQKSPRQGEATNQRAILVIGYWASSSSSSSSRRMASHGP